MYMLREMHHLSLDANTNQPENRIYAEQLRIAPVEEEEVRKIDLNNSDLVRQVTLIDCVAQMLTLISQYNQLQILNYPGERIS